MGGKMKREMIFWIAVTLFFRVNGRDVSFQYDGCYSSKDGITMTAEYTGSGTVTAVQWYYSGKTGSNLFVLPGTCSLAGSIPPGYPAADQMEFQCIPPSDPTTFKLTVTGLEGEDLQKSWGATFSLSVGDSPAVAESSFSECDCGLIVFHNCNLSKGVGVFLWCFTSICLVALVTVVVILILRFVIGVKFPCRILNCENKRTSPKGSKSEKKSTEGKHQGTQDEENKILALQDTNYTKKRPPAKLDQLDEPGSKKHHIGGRPLPEIGKYN